MSFIRRLPHLDQPSYPVGTDEGGDWDDQELFDRRYFRWAVGRGMRYIASFRTKAGRYPDTLAFRQSGEHVDPRRSDTRHRAADDGGVQQPRPLRPANRAIEP